MPFISITPKAGSESAKVPGLIKAMLLLAAVIGVVASSDLSASQETPATVLPSPVPADASDSESEEATAAEGSTNPATSENELSDADSEDDASDEVDDELDSLLDSSLETLSATQATTPDLNAEVTTVSRTEKPVGKTPSAVFVITNEMIRRSGARTLPDVLRMVPGLHVARLTNGAWSIGMRGNSGNATNDLLVQVDGRSIYSKFFGGTLWGNQDFVLEDIDRIEVIRGPGGSVWGANAVRGVINIVTKNSSETQGLFIEGAAGNELRHTETARYGGQTSLGSYRIWGRNLRLDGGEFPNGVPDTGFWNPISAGFRVDLNQTFFDRLTVDLGYFESSRTSRSALAQLTPPFVNQGVFDTRYQSWFANVTGEYVVSDNESMLTRGSFYSTELEGTAGQFNPMNQIELDFQHNIQRTERQEIVWGTSFRRTTIDVIPTAFLEPINPDFAVNTYGAFLQNTYSIDDRTAITVGTKLSYNDLSGFEHQPSGRIVFNPTPKTAVWASLSRAVRTPTFHHTNARIRTLPLRTFPLPMFGRISGNDGLAAEDLLAVEVGIRQQPQKHFFWDLSAYHFTFRDIIATGTPGAPLPGVPGTLELPIPIVNLDGTSEVAGIELFSKYEMNDSWRLSGSYTYTHNWDDRFRFPTNSLYLQSSHNLTPDTELDLIWRYLDNFGDVDHYNTADVRFSWRFTDAIELSVVGQNLLRPSQFEEAPTPIAGNQPSAAQRGVLGMVQVRY
ncbi:MAG: TonB-dependent receptor plug domain-containing protein [Planctomycetaceae bacterium]